jgi:hypothetical protein
MTARHVALNFEMAISSMVPALSEHSTMVNMNGQSVFCSKALTA